MYHTLGKLKRGKKGSFAEYGKGKYKKKALPIIDLNAGTNAEPGSSGPDEAGLTTRQQHFVVSLKADYSNHGDNKCKNKNKPCRINKDGEHVALTWQQLHSWAVALVSTQYHGTFCLVLICSLHPYPNRGKMHMVSHSRSHQRTTILLDSIILRNA